MQLHITFSGERIRLPIATGETLQGLLYRALRSDPQYSSFMHNVGVHADGRAFKLFHFSEPTGAYETEKDADGRLWIVFLSELHWEVRSIQPRFIQLVYEYFSSNPTVRLGNNTVSVSALRLEDTHIYSDRIRVRTRSPITVYRTEENGHTTYFTPDMPLFYEAINTNARRKWLSNGGREQDFSLTVEPVSSARYKRRCTRFKQTLITAYHGEFLLGGSPAVLDFLYHTGLGAKNSQGFGMIGLSR